MQKLFASRSRRTIAYGEPAGEFLPTDRLPLLEPISRYQASPRLEHIEQAFRLNHADKCLTTILDDAHLLDLANLRKLRLLFENFPNNLAQRFNCSKNLNAIDLLMRLGHDFISAVVLLERLLERPCSQRPKRDPTPAVE